MQNRDKKFNKPQAKCKRSCRIISNYRIYFWSPSQKHTQVGGGHGVLQRKLSEMFIFK